MRTNELEDALNSLSDANDRIKQLQDELDQERDDHHGSRKLKAGLESDLNLTDKELQDWKRKYEEARAEND